MEHIGVANSKCAPPSDKQIVLEYTRDGAGDMQLLVLTDKNYFIGLASPKSITIIKVASTPATCCYHFFCAHQPPVRGLGKANSHGIRSQGTFSEDPADSPAARWWRWLWRRSWRWCSWERNTSSGYSQCRRSCHFQLNIQRYDRLALQDWTFLIACS